MKKWIALFGIVSFITLASRYGSVGESATPLATATPAFVAYLPAVLKGYAGPPATATATSVPTATLVPTATATATLIPTATPIPCNGSVQALQNINFASDFDYWTILSGSPSIYSLLNLRFLLLGEQNNAVDMVGQAVTVPAWAETAALYFTYYAELFEDSWRPPVDFFLAAVVDEDYNIIASYELNNTTAEHQRYRDFRVPVPGISAYRGSVVGVVLGATNDAHYATKWYLPDVELWFGCGNTPASENEDTLIPDSDGRQYSDAMLDLRRLAQ